MQDELKGWLMQCENGAWILLWTIREMAMLLSESFRTVERSRLNNTEVSLPECWVRLMTDVEKQEYFPSLSDMGGETTIGVLIPEQLVKTPQFQLYLDDVKFLATVFPDQGILLSANGSDFEAIQKLDLTFVCLGGGIPPFQP